MAETATESVYELPENPVYHEDIPKLTQDDSVDADEVVNPLIQKILENAHAVKKELDELQASKGQPDGIASLDSGGKVPTNQILFPISVGVRDDDGDPWVDGIDYGLKVLRGFDLYGNPVVDLWLIGRAINFTCEFIDVTGTMDMHRIGKLINLPEPTEPSDAATLTTVVDAVNSKLPQVFTVTIPATNAGATGSISRTFPSCTANETDCIVDASPAAASWDAFYDCNFRLKSISPTGFTYTVDSNLTSPMTVYITVQDITPLDTVPEGGA